MTEKYDTGGPAFPRPHSGSTQYAQEGMTLRDYFAAKAMQGIIAGWHTGLPPSKDTAQSAYSYADAMLKARNPS